MRATKPLLGALVLTLLPVFPAEGQDRRTRTPEELAEWQRRQEAMMTAPRPIEGINSIWIDELTWMEVRDEIATGKTTGIIATGGVEQNGPYMAGGKHNYVLEAICDAIARELGDALCAPVMKYVPEGDPENIRYPGTLSVRQETFRMVLEDVANSLKSQGFTDVVFIGDSGGNQNGMSETADRLNDHWDGAARAHYIEEYYREDIWSCEFLKEELQIFQQPDICSATRDLYHDDVHYSAIVATVDPGHIRARQRIEAGLYSINEVELGPVARTVEIGRALIEYRTAITVRAIRASLAR
ncbi:MAG: creatininase family protein [Gemmatimonadetes bacterium]|nr:creatininase family protein [Gemmatimonadota bacterium]MCY3676414.1 creatininase family protein [Gemmatimonadota bacterium]